MDQLFIVCEGSSALSEFRRNLLAEQIGALEVRAQYVHYVSLKSSEGHDQGILKQLLSYGSSQDIFHFPDDQISRYGSLRPSPYSGCIAFTATFAKRALWVISLRYN